MKVRKRRCASTETIHQLWDAIVYCRGQKQIPNIERLANYVKRKHQTALADLEEMIECSMMDGLIELKTVRGFKGSKVGIEQKSWRIPEEPPEKDEHDWYCFGCHKWGAVVFCSSCERVYHPECLTETIEEKQKLVCHVCKLLGDKKLLGIEIDDQNLLLNYCVARMKEKVFTCPEVIKIPLLEADKWRHDLLIYRTMDLSIIEDNTVENVYLSLEDFQVDVMTMVHNVVIYHGVHSIAADNARLLLRDCMYDLGEIRQCHFCYRTSNEKRNKQWFCQPCSPPHELVYAKQKGYTFWPAKVISVSSGMYDVRFFGGYHERAILEKEYIKPITTPMQQLQLKRSATLNKALDELKRHQQILGQIPKDKRSSPVKRSPVKQSPVKPGRPPKAVTAKAPPAAGPPKHPGRPRGRKRKRPIESDDVDEETLSRDECPTSTSPRLSRFRDAPTPEDHNVVSSSCQESSPSMKVTVSTQTHKKLLSYLIPKVVEKAPPPCDCDAKFTKALKDYKEKADLEHSEDKARTLKELAERLRLDFAEEKQVAVSGAMQKVEAEMGEARRKSEERLQSEHQMEMQSLMEHHRSEVSDVKKKQWCYNCEVEAIYHCCWNTSYCSIDCQQVHWHKEHKRTCRRKR